MDRSRIVGFSARVLGECHEDETCSMFAWSCCASRNLPFARRKISVALGRYLPGVSLFIQLTIQLQTIQTQFMTLITNSNSQQPATSFRGCRKLIARILMSGLAVLAAFSIRGAQTVALQTVHAFGVAPRNPIGSLVQMPNGLLYGVSMGGTNRFGAVYRMTTNGVLLDTVSLDIDTGESPCATLTKGKDGNLYGVANSQGTNSSGGIFKVETSGALKVTPFYAFAQSPDISSRAALCLGVDGVFYGARSISTGTNYGSIFKIGTNAVFSNLFYFNNTNGAYPFGTLIQGNDGTLYGTTEGGGASNNNGTIFKITTNGVFTSLHDFDYVTGSESVAGLEFGADGFLYGTTSSGGIGYGLIFRTETNGNVAVLHTFDGTDGNWPCGKLVEGLDGSLYGTTYGNNGSDRGNIFKITTNGTYSVVVVFDGTNGARPRYELMRSTDGNFYGTTSGGGAHDGGTVFKLTPNGTLTTLYSFEVDGAEADNTLVRMADGYLYGVTEYGGTDDYGQFFRISPSGVYSNVTSIDYAHGGYSRGKLACGPDGALYGTLSYSTFSGKGGVFKADTNGVLSTLAIFYGTNGAYPYAGLTIASDGNFYGTTKYGGTNADLGAVIKISTNGIITTLACFNGTNGANPAAMLVQGTDGQLYGTTAFGGTSNKGTVFKITTNGVLTTLVSFGGVVNGESPGSLLLASNGVMYGTTAYGGTNSAGTIFKLVAGGIVTLFHFHKYDGYLPCSDLMESADGYLYGATAYGGDFGLGTVFRMTTNGTFTSLAPLKGDQAYPSSGLAMGNDGQLYGTTAGGGYGIGTIFRVMFVPVITNIVKQAGGVVQISGSGGPVNQPFRLLASTNVALPTAMWTPIKTNAFDKTGAFSVSDNTASSLKMRFYRIVAP
jgi:uncharacterized repeat protein (TIGR03803 family)